MTGKSKNKKVNPTNEIKKLHKEVVNLISQVDVVVDTYEKHKVALSDKTRDTVEPMIETLKRDRETYLQEATGSMEKISGIKEPKRVEQYMRVHQAGTELFSQIDKITTATLPVVADVVAIIDEEISK